MKKLFRRALRTFVSFIPSASLLFLRKLKDIPLHIAGYPHERDFLLLRYLDEKPSTVLDIGANRGQSIRSLRLVLDRPIIHAFEPNTQLSEELSHQYHDNGVTVHPYGLSSENCQATIFVPRYGHTIYDTRASLSELNASSFLNRESFLFFKPERAAIEQSNVVLKRLDDLGLTPSIIKIDVEGLDDKVVQGGLETLRRNQPACLIEHPQPETTMILQELGYAVFGYVGDRLVQNHRGVLNVFFLMPQHVIRLSAAGVVFELGQHHE